MYLSLLTVLPVHQFTALQFVAGLLAVFPVLNVPAMALCFMYKRFSAPAPQASVTLSIQLIEWLSGIFITLPSVAQRVYPFPAQKNVCECVCVCAFAKWQTQDSLLGTRMKNSKRHYLLTSCRWSGGPLRLRTSFVYWVYGVNCQILSQTQTHTCTYTHSHLTSSTMWKDFLCAQTRQTV